MHTNINVHNAAGLRIERKHFADGSHPFHRLRVIATDEGGAEFVLTYYNDNRLEIVGADEREEETA